MQSSECANVKLEKLPCSVSSCRHFIMIWWFWVELICSFLSVCSQSLCCIFLVHISHYMFFCFLHFVSSLHAIKSLQEPLLLCPVWQLISQATLPPSRIQVYSLSSINSS